MNNEIAAFLLKLVISFEGLASLFSIIFWKRYNHTVLKYLPIVLSYSFLTEMYGLFFTPISGNNTLLFNLLSFVFFSYFLFVYYSHAKNTTFKKILGLGQITFLFSTLINAIIENPTKATLLYSYCVGGTLIIVATILFFIEKLEAKDSFKIKSDLLFWISVGLLLFYVGYLPIKLTRLYIASLTDPYRILQIVQFLLGILMNSFFILGFIWTRKK